MNSEYLKNNRKQKSLLKKYSKYIKKALIGGGLALIGLFVIPGLGLGNTIIRILPFLSKLIPASYDAAATITVWTSIIMASLGTIKGLINGLKAHSVKEDLKVSFDEEEELFENIKLEYEKEKEKNKNFEEELHELKEKINLVSMSKETNNNLDKKNSKENKNINSLLFNNNEYEKEKEHKLKR